VLPVVADAAGAAKAAISATRNIIAPMKGQKTILEIALGVVIVIAVAIGVHRIQPYLVPPIPAPVVVQTISPGAPPPLALRKLAQELSSAVSTYASSPALQLFGPGVRTLKYDSSFFASAAVEGGNGDLYISYDWAPFGYSRAYDPDSIGIVTGGAVREIFKGNFLDQATIVGEDDGYPVYDVASGETPHQGDYYGTWHVDAGGPFQISNREPAPLECTWCLPVGAESTAPPVCSDFAGGRLCNRSSDVTYARNGAPIVTLHGARVVGAGRDRFLIMLAAEGPSSRSYVEGFAVPR
jgi:hypothetical protein